jgi:hypothetical protein
MSEIKHSEGPWGMSSESPRIIKQYDSLGETNVIIGSASAYPKSGFFPSDEVALANARLICAAPDLLEALLALLKDEEWHAAMADEVTLGARDNIRIARAAIEKATGEKA